MRYSEKIQTSAVIFDVDGTLVRESIRPFNTSSVKDDLFNTVLRQHFTSNMIDFGGAVTQGLTDWLIAEKAVSAVYPGYRIGREQWKDIAFEISGRFSILPPSHRHFRNLIPIDGIHLLLNRLKDSSLRLGVGTGNLRCFADAKLQQSALSDYFEIGAYGEDGKTRVDILSSLLTQLNVTANHRVVLVGDSEYDADAAATLGFRFIGVGPSFSGKGHVSPVEALPCCLHIRDFSDLSSILLFLEITYYTE
jgi:phosphoglycolate phosphatase-like HAD superfamily hydrolase